MINKEIYYCDPADFAGYRGCGKVAKKEEWKKRKLFWADNLSLCPYCRKAGTNVPVTVFNLWRVEDPDERKRALKLLDV